MSGTEISSMVVLMVAVGTLAWGIVKGRPEIADVASDTAIALSVRMGELEAAIDAERKARRALETVVTDLEISVREYRRGTRILVAQLKSYNIIPNWAPPSE